MIELISNGHAKIKEESSRELLLCLIEELGEEMDEIFGDNPEIVDVDQITSLLEGRLSEKMGSTLYRVLCLRRISSDVVFTSPCFRSWDFYQEAFPDLWLFRKKIMTVPVEMKQIGCLFVLTENN